MKASSPDLPTTCSDFDVGKFLEQHDGYIRTLARKNVYRTRRLFHPAVLELEVDEVAQKARVKFWQASLQRNIADPKAYISSIVHNEAVTMTRQPYRFGPLPLNEDGEVYQGRILVEVSEGMGDPAFELEQVETKNYYISQTAYRVAKLAPRQQRGMICSLKDRLDEFMPFVAACKNWGVNADVIDWPSEQNDLQRLRASISVAKRTVRSLFNEPIITG
ncbi:MAG: hypothetical protein JO202_10940 [Ktedonobacteraceae bacterium]|nr:hypothetical protein [Ktedonobacteraceae bacterium]